MTRSIERTKCIDCGQTALAMDLVWRADGIGAASLAGQQIKTTAKLLPLLFCKNPECKFEMWGWVEDGSAVFPIIASEVERAELIAESDPDRSDA